LNPAISIVCSICIRRHSKGTREEERKRKGAPLIVTVLAGMSDDDELNESDLLDPQEEEAIFKVEEEALQKYLTDMRLDNLFSELVEELLVDAPNNPVQFMIDYLFTHYPDQARNSSFAKTFPNASNAVGSGIPLTGLTDFEVGVPDEDDEVSQEISKPANIKRSRRRNALCMPLTAYNYQASTGADLTDDQSNELLEYLSVNRIFSKLELYQRKAIIQLFKVVDFERDHVICEESKPLENFYVLSKGKCNQMRGSALIATVKHGGSFGEMGLLYDNIGSTSVCVSSERATLFCINLQTYRTCLPKIIEEERNSVISYIQRISFFQTFTDLELLKLAEDVVTRKSYREGSLIVKQHQPSDAFIIIKSGSVICKQRIAPTEPWEDISVFQAGDYFGQVALITDRPRAASVTALTDVECYVISRASFVNTFGSFIHIVKRDTPLFNSFISDKI